MESSTSRAKSVQRSLARVCLWGEHTSLPIKTVLHGGSYAVPRCACWGVRLSMPSHAILELLDPPCDQDPSFMDHEVRVRQHNPLTRYHVQHEPGGLLISTRASFLQKNQENKPNIWDLIISSNGVSTASPGKSFQRLIMLMKSMELL